MSTTMNQRKFENVVLFICERARGEMTSVRLNKLLWLIDKTAFLKLAHTITDWVYIRKRFGPVPVDNYEALGLMGDNGDLEIIHSRDDDREKTQFIPHKTPDLSFFDERELEVMDEVLNTYGATHWRKLVDLSHDLAWATHDDGERIPFEVYLSARQDAKDIPSIREMIAREERKYAQCAGR